MTLVKPDSSATKQAASLKTERKIALQIQKGARAGIHRRGPSRYLAEIHMPAWASCITFMAVRHVENIDVVRLAVIELLKA